MVVIIFVSFIVISLFWIKIIKLCFVCKVNLLDLLFITVNLIFHVSLLAEKSVQMMSLLIILVLDMHKERFDIFRFCIRAMFIERQVIVRKFTFIASNIFDKILVFSF